MYRDRDHGSRDLTVALPKGVLDQVIGLLTHKEALRLGGVSTSLAAATLAYDCRLALDIDNKTPAWSSPNSSAKQLPYKLLRVQRLWCHLQRLHLRLPVQGDYSGLLNLLNASSAPALHKLHVDIPCGFDAGGSTAAAPITLQLPDLSIQLPALRDLSIVCLQGGSHDCLIATAPAPYIVLGPLPLRLQRLRLDAPEVAFAHLEACDAIDGMCKGCGGGRGAATWQQPVNGGHSCHATQTLTELQVVDVGRLGIAAAVHILSFLPTTARLERLALQMLQPVLPPQKVAGTSAASTALSSASAGSVAEASEEALLQLLLPALAALRMAPGRLALVTSPGSVAHALPPPACVAAVPELELTLLLQTVDIERLVVMDVAGGVVSSSAGGNGCLDVGLQDQGATAVSHTARPSFSPLARKDLAKVYPNLRHLGHVWRPLAPGTIGAVGCDIYRNLVSVSFTDVTYVHGLTNLAPTLRSLHASSRTNLCVVLPHAQKLRLHSLRLSARKALEILTSSNTLAAAVAEEHAGGPSLVDTLLGSQLTELLIGYAIARGAALPQLLLSFHALQGAETIATPHEEASMAAQPSATAAAAATTPPAATTSVAAAAVAAAPMTGTQAVGGCTAGLQDCLATPSTGAAGAASPQGLSSSPGPTASSSLPPSPGTAVPSQASCARTAADPTAVLLDRAVLAVQQVQLVLSASGPKQQMSVSWQLTYTASHLVRAFSAAIGLGPDLDAYLQHAHNAALATKATAHGWESVRMPCTSPSLPAASGVPPAQVEGSKPAPGATNCMQAAATADGSMVMSERCVYVRCKGSSKGAVTATGASSSSSSSSNAPLLCGDCIISREDMFTAFGV